MERELEQDQDLDGEQVCSCSECGETFVTTFTDTSQSGDCFGLPGMCWSCGYDHRSFEDMDEGEIEAVLLGRGLTKGQVTYCLDDRWTQSDDDHYSWLERAGKEEIIGWIERQE